MPTKRKKPRKPPEFRLGFLVHDVSRMRRTVFDQAMRPLGVTRNQWWLLANLSRELDEGMTQTELAKMMEIGKDSIGGLVDRLEATGHVERRPDPVDRRANRVHMTAAGRTVHDAMIAVARTLNKRVVEGIDEKDIRLVEDILFRMKKNLRASLSMGGLPHDDAAFPHATEPASG